jgi:hypothetical protein
MKLYKKIIDGKQHCKPANKIVIVKDGMQTFNPTEEMLLADGWVEHITVPYEPTEEELLKQAKQRKKIEIDRYDKSSDVNEFFVSGVSLWLSKEDRTGLKLRFESELAMGKTATTLWANGVQFPLPLVGEDGSVGLAFQMLFALELYASACYDNTQLHLSVVDKLETIEEVESYDFKVGYPEKLNF